MGFHKMPWLWKHPKTGIYWFRRATPRDLMAARGQLEAFDIKVPREALKTLGTRDPDEAERLACEENQRCVARWNSWRKLLADGPRVLSQKEVFALSAQIARRLNEHMSDNPGDPERRKRMQRVLSE